MANKYGLEKIAETSSSYMSHVAFQPGSNDGIVIVRKDNIIINAIFTEAGLKDRKFENIFENPTRTDKLVISRDLESVADIEKIKSQEDPDKITLSIANRKKESWFRRNVPESVAYLFLGLNIQYENSRDVAIISANCLSTNLTMSHNGDYIALTTGDKLLVYENKRNKIHDFAKEMYNAAAFNWQGDRLCVAVTTPQNGHELRFYKIRVETGVIPEHRARSYIIELEGFRTKLKYGVDAIEFSSDGKHLITATGDIRGRDRYQGIRIYEIGKEGPEFKHRPGTEHPSELGSSEISDYQQIILSQDSTRLLTLSREKLELYNVSLR